MYDTNIYRERGSQSDSVCDRLLKGGDDKPGCEVEGVEREGCEFAGIRDRAITIMLIMRPVVERRSELWLEVSSLDWLSNF